LYLQMRSEAPPGRFFFGGPVGILEILLLGK
jgi:hypothetical protein